MKRAIKLFLLQLIFGKRTVNYMSITLFQDPRLLSVDANADIVIDRNGQERRIEADWLKDLARVVVAPDQPSAPPSNTSRSSPGGGYAEAIPLQFNERSR